MEDPYILSAIFNEEIAPINTDLEKDLIYAGPVAYHIGWNFDQTVRALDLFYGVGLSSYITEDGSVIHSAGVSLRGILSRLINPNYNTLTTLKKYDISLKEVDPKTHTFKEILTLFSKKKVLVDDIVTIFGARGADFWALMTSYKLN